MACSRPRTAPRSASSCSGSGGLSVGTEAWATNGLRRAQRAVFACFWPLYIECCLCMHYFRFCTCKMLCMHYFRFYICKMSIVCLLYSPWVLNSALHALFCFFCPRGHYNYISCYPFMWIELCLASATSFSTSPIHHHHHHCTASSSSSCASQSAMQQCVCGGLAFPTVCLQMYPCTMCVCKCILKALERCCRVYALHYVAWLSPLKCVGLVETYQLLLLPGAYQGT